MGDLHYAEFGEFRDRRCEVDVEVEDVRGLEAVEDSYTWDVGEGLRMLGEMAEEGADGEEDGSVVLFDCLVLIDAENAGVDWLVDGTRFDMAFREKHLTEPYAAIAIYTSF